MVFSSTQPPPLNDFSPHLASPVGEMLVTKHIEKQARRQMDVEIAFFPEGCPLVCL